MKKTYITPTIEERAYETIEIIAASLTGITDEGGSTTLTDEVAESGSDAMSRRGNSWDILGDDEEY